MDKELEALNKLFVLSSEYHQKLWCLKLAPVFPEERERYIDRIIKSLPNDAGELNDLYNYIKQALKRNEPVRLLVHNNNYGIVEAKSAKDYNCDEWYCAMGYCPICGAQNPIFNNFCGKCGTKLDKFWEEK